MQTTRDHSEIVLVRQPPFVGGSFYYRALQPFLRHQGARFVKEPTGREEYSAAFFWAPQGKADLSAIIGFKERGIPVICDLDDDLFNLPTDIAGTFSDPSYLALTRAALELSDTVTVSTKALLDRQTHPHVVLVPNAWDFETFPYQPIKDYSKVIMWRGARGHQKDWESVETEVATLLRKYTDWNIAFYGEPPNITSDIIKDSSQRVSFKLFPEYLDHASKLAPAIMLIPLEINAHNAVKSNCAWLEGSYIGACVVAPELPEFKAPGITNYKDPIDLYCKLEWLVNRVGHRKLVNDSRRAIENYLSTKKINEVREDIFR